MKVIINPSKKEWKIELARPVQKIKEIEKIIKPIMRKVKRQGDKALRKFALEYDHVEIKSLLVDREEIKASYDQVNGDLKNAIMLAKQNIEKFHQAQVTPDLEMEVMPGVTC